MNRAVYNVVMAGGVGSRFWPMSRKESPKQFIDILGNGQTMLQETVDRMSRFAPLHKTIILTGERYTSTVEEQLPDLPKGNILSEPERRNTAPCIAYAAYKILAQDPDAVMVVTPSDHCIADLESFWETLSRGIEYVEEHDVLLTIGIKPTYPAVGYGYIELTEKAKANGLGPIVRFKEKPSREVAEEFLSTGMYLWNSGMFIWKVRDIVKAFEAHLPDVARLFSGVSSYGTAQEAEAIKAAFIASQSISIDFGVMEKASNVHVLSGDFGWDDLGTWGALHRYTRRGGDKQEKPHILIDSDNTLIRTATPSKKVIAVGLEEYLIVDMPDILFIAPKGDEAALHELIGKVSREVEES